ncbi:HAD family hydrolase [bacterium]|nr:HAD family hydrolase [bacterium]
MPIDTIAFDADDTLWHSEVHFREASAEINDLLSQWQTEDDVDRILNEIEMHNLPLYGYGVKGYILSMVEGAIAVSDGDIRADQVGRILALGQQMLKAEVELRPGVEACLEALSGKYPLIVITKGDLLDQNDKVQRSGLADYFSAVEVVSQKSSEVYAGILERHHLAPENFLMVGNSLPSDIIPVLALGGKAVHIPADTTWAHEMVDDFDRTQSGFYELEHLGELPDLLAKGI